MYPIYAACGELGIPIFVCAGVPGPRIPFMPQEVSRIDIVMFDFPDSEGLQRITREIFERGGIVSSVCHGYCGLLNTRLSDGTLLVDGRHLTGFAWSEEVLARVNKLVPYNAEEEMKKRGARYEKGLIPFASYVVVDGRLVTGQNPGSAKATAKKVVSVLQG